MNVLIKSVMVYAPGSKFNGQELDVHVADGKIAAIDRDLKAEDNLVLIDGKGKYLFPGFLDLNVNFGDPGFETREDIDTGTAAAAAGGFTAVALMPNTNPPVYAKSAVEYIRNRSRGLLVDVYPLGCLSYKNEGKELSEMFDMLQSGAVAFTDGNRPVQDAGLMSRALLYTRSFNGLIMAFAEDTHIAGNAKMNEGEMSTYLGMKGNPSLAEELMISRDLYLAEYNDARIHFSTISSRGSVELIRRAKAAGIKVTCDVAAHSLALTDKMLAGFDSNYKVRPPLRTEDDRKALIAGLEDGTIDAIVSQHTPHDVEFKNVEFEIAYFGITGLQTVLPLLIKIGLRPELIAEKLAVGPRRVLGLKVPDLAVGSEANFTVVDPAEEWRFDESSNYSRSSNNPLFGENVKGRVKLTYNKGQAIQY